MKARTPPVVEALRTDLAWKPGHAEWMRAKVERAVVEAKARETMIPAEQV